MEIRTKRGGFSEAFKLHVLREIEEGTLRQAEAKRKYRILGHSTILKWQRRYGLVKESKPSRKERRFMMLKDEHEVQRLQRENKALREELDDARMKHVVLDTMIDIAEKELGIPIRKKFGAGQLGK